MTDPGPGRLPARRDPLTYTAAAAVGIAVALPAPWLVAPDGGTTGGWLLRGFLVVLAALLVATRRVGAPGPLPPTGALRDPVLLGLVLVACALRAVRLGTELWFDEIWMLVDFVRLPLRDLLHTYGSDNNHPLYTLSAWASVRLFGETHSALRLPAAALGAANVAALYVFARPRLGRAAALLSAGALALLPQHVAYSQNARGYTGLLLCSLLASHYLLVAVRTGARRAWLLQGGFLALAVHFHLTGAFLGFGHLAVVLLARRRRALPTAPDGIRAALCGIALGAVLALALHALLLPGMAEFLLPREGGAGGDAAWKDPLWLVGETARGLAGSTAAGLVVLGLGCAVLGWGLWTRRRRSPELLLLLLVPAVSLSVAMLVLGRNLWPRMYFFLVGFALPLLVAIGLDGCAAAGRRLLRSAPERGARIASAAGAAFVLLAALAMLPRAYALPKQDYPAAAAWVHANRRPGEPVVTVGLARMPYEVYYREPFTPIVEVEDLRSATSEGGLVLTTFPHHLRSWESEIARHLDEHAREVARFPGAIGDGDLIVLRIGD